MKNRATILIVDDERLNIDTLAFVLKDHYELMVAKNGFEALKRIESGHPPDLVLLDIVMPDMDGFEVCRRIKENPDTAEIPIIFISAKRDVEAETHGFDLGAVDYITKPFSPPIVRARVETQLKLIRTNRILREQNERLEQTAAMRETVERISRHDMKNPLSGIISMPQMLLRELDLQPCHQEMLRSIMRAGNRLLEMINRSLDLYKMETGSYSYNPTQVDLMEILSRIREELGSLAEDREVTFMTIRQGLPRSGDEPLVVNGEELLCYSLFANLIRNAVEASPEGRQVTLAIDESETDVKISIRNRGVVPPEIRDRFFEKFITHGKSGGTGLGTYSARLMTEIQGGNIGFESSENIGVTVWVRLPKPPASDDARLREIGVDWVN